MIDPLYSELTRLSDSRDYLVAYSGGIDSHVLLFALTKIRDQYPEINIRALHVHHGLNKNADNWLQHCKDVCHLLNVPFLSEKIHLTNNDESLEAEARRERYRVLARHLHENECLLTAHNQDDQAETVLLQLLRGAGPKGLSAMPFKKPFVHSLHLRPLLKVSRDEISEYARKHQLEWIEDDSNSDERFDRNYVRHSVMPVLLQRWPSAANSLARSASHCGSASELMHCLAEDDFTLVQGTQENTLSVLALMQLSESRRFNVLRHWFERNACRLPNTQHLLQIQRDVLQCQSDAEPEFLIESKTLRRYRDDLYLVDNEAFDSSQEIVWDCRSSLHLPGNGGVLHAEQFSEFKQLTVRFRRGGECIKPEGSSHTQSLKKLFQRWGIPPWERDRIPLLFDGDELVGIVLSSEGIKR